MHILCINASGGSLISGDTVYISGSSGEHPSISKASASVYDQAHSTIGMVTSEANNGEHCMVTVLGTVHGINTSALSPSTILYLSPTVAGGFTTVKPTTDKTVVRIGWVVKQDTSDGEIFVSPQIEMNTAGYYLDAQTRTDTTAIPAVPAAFVWSTTVSDTYDSYNASTGVITLPFDGMYSFAFSYNCATTGVVKQLYSAAEYWNGSSWEKLQYSCRQSAVRLDDKNQSIFVSHNRFTAGTQIRFTTWGSTTGINVITESPSDGYTIPAARILITGVKTI